MSKTIFEEEQRFRQWWIWLVLLFVLITNLVIAFKEENLSETGNIVVFSFILLMFLLLFFSNLKTRIDEQGIHIRFSPFHFSTVSYLWENIYSADVKQYSPVGDYGGWGVRISFTGKGKAFNVSGNKGIYLVTSDGKKRMIGTQKEIEAKEVIEQYFKTKPSNR